MSTRRLAFDRAFDAPLAAVAVPHAVVEAELHFLLDVAGEIVGRDPTGVDVERRLAAVGVLVDQSAAASSPRCGPSAWPDQAALAGACHALQPSAEREVDQLDVMHGDVRAGIAPDDPLGELLAGDLLRLQQRAVAVVDVLAASPSATSVRSFL